MPIYGQGSIGLAPALRDGHHIAILFLHLFSQFKGKVQSNGNIVADLISSYGQDGGIIDAVVLEDGDIGSATTDIGEQDTTLSLLFSEDSLSAGKGFQNEVVNLNADATDALGQVLDGVYRRSNDVCLNIQAEAIHADRVLDPLLTIDDVGAGDDVKQLSLAGNFKGVGNLENAFKSSARTSRSLRVIATTPRLFAELICLPVTPT